MGATKGLHRWYSRKPLSFSRASVLGSLLPADVSMEEFEWLLGLNRRRKDGFQDKKTKLYKTPPSPDRIQKVQELCEQMWGTKTPTVLDAFAGGGSIPFEAARYGLNVLASDLNPVAVVTMKAAIEYPLKFGADLQVDINRWVKWVGDEAEKRLAPFFPSLPGEKVQNYLWAHTVKCPNCESIVPLSPNWWLYKRPEKQNLNKWCAVQPIPNLAERRVDFELVKGKKGKGTTIVYQQGGNQNGGRQDACPTDLNLDPVAKASSLQIAKNPQLKTTKRHLPHWELDGSVYFVTFNTWEKLELSEAARQVVLDACQFFDGQRYKIFSISVMPDHVHWLIQPLQKSEDEY